MKKKTLIMVLTGCMVLSPVSVYAADATETTTEAEVTETAAQEDSADSESTGELGDDIYSFSMEFDGQIMKFPMTYQNINKFLWLCIFQQRQEQCQCRGHESWNQ